EVKINMISRRSNNRIIFYILLLVFLILIPTLIWSKNSVKLYNMNYEYNYNDNLESNLRSAYGDRFLDTFNSSILSPAWTWSPVDSDYSLNDESGWFSMDVAPNEDTWGGNFVSPRLYQNAPLNNWTIETFIQTNASLHSQTGLLFFESSSRWLVWGFIYDSESDSHKTPGVGLEGWENGVPREELYFSAISLNEWESGVYLRIQFEMDSNLYIFSYKKNGDPSYTIMGTRSISWSNIQIGLWGKSWGSCPGYLSKFDYFLLDQNIQNGTDTLYAESFNDGIANGWEIVEGTWSVVDGKYYVSTSGEDARSYYSFQNFSRFIYEGDIMLIQGNQLTIPFLIQDISLGRDNGHYYQIVNFESSLYTENIRLGHVSNGHAWLKNEQAPFYYNQWYHFKLKVNGTNIEYSLNDSLILTYNSISYSKGYIGLKVIFDSTQAYYDNLIVRSLSPISYLENQSLYYDNFSITWDNDASNRKDFNFIDLNDDGQLELIRHMPDYKTSIYTLNGNDYEFYANISIRVYEFGDYDGDGVNELVGMPGVSYDYFFYNFSWADKTLNHENTWVTGYDDRGKICFGDLEGDGKEEFIYVDNGIEYGGHEGRRRLISFNGSEFVELHSFDDTSTSGWDGYADATLIDIDGDGRDEIACSWGYGSGFDGGIRIFDDHLNSYSLLQEYQFYRDPTFLSQFDEHEDLNGDGCEDLVTSGGQMGVDHYRYIIFYNSSSSSFSYQQLVKQCGNQNYLYGVGKLFSNDEYGRYISFFSASSGNNEFWTDVIRIYTWLGNSFGDPIEIELDKTYSTPYQQLRLRVRDISGDGFDEIIWDGSDSEGKQVTHFIFFEESFLDDVNDTITPDVNDTTAPTITILAPEYNQHFGRFSPAYSLSIEDDNMEEFGLQSIWYTLDGGITNISIIELIGVIDEDLWDALPEGVISIDFYALDSSGNQGNAGIIITKDLVNITSSDSANISGYNLFMICLTFLLIIIVIRAKLKRKIRNH
ncbi:MAG: family 16 glycoside hydrolase, partial [Promethearchaeota archaeon]